MEPRATIFSPCRVYRYTLWRTWDMFNPTYLQVIGLNPSTADETQDDPTIRRCVDFAKRWGYGALCMTNLFAYRATKPQDLLTAAMPIGVDNNRWLEHIAGDASLILAAWGTHGDYRERAALVALLLYGLPLYCLGTNTNHTPKHPLYVTKTTQPVVYREALERKERHVCRLSLL